jgi:hypothetical protein
VSESNGNEPRDSLVRSLLVLSTHLGGLTTYPLKVRLFVTRTLTLTLS